MFVFLSVYVWPDSGRRKYPILLKFDANIYVLCEIKCRVFGYLAQIAGEQGRTKLSQYIMAYGGKFFKISFDMVIVHKI